MSHKRKIDKLGSNIIQKPKTSNEPKELPLNTDTSTSFLKKQILNFQIVTVLIFINEKKSQ